MLLFLIILIALGIILQRFYGISVMKYVSCTIQSSFYLIEPEQPFELIFTINNNSILPVFFLQFECLMPNGIQVTENQPGSLSVGSINTQYKVTCFLLPKQSVTYHIQFTLKERGIYRFSQIKLSIGDFLGQSEYCERREIYHEIVVIPQKSNLCKDLMPFGGIFGNISVNRWIYEDPILTVGFHEYTGTESQKSISWPRSLQSNHLMVRQFDHTAQSQVMVLLDVSGTNETVVEDCYSICRSVCEKLTEKTISFSFYHNAGLYSRYGAVKNISEGIGIHHYELITEGLGRAVPEAISSTSSLVASALKGNPMVCSIILVLGCNSIEKRSQFSLLERKFGLPVQVLTPEEGPLS